MKDEILNDYLSKLIKDYRVRIAKSTDTMEILCLNDIIEDLKSIIRNFL